MLNIFTIQLMTDLEESKHPSAHSLSGPSPADALGDVFSEIFASIGASAALALSRAVGGQRIYIPREFKEDHRLFSLGPDICAWLSERLGGKTIEFPLGPAGRRDLEAKMIALLNGHGLSANQVAEQVGVTVRTVYQHRRRLKNSPATDGAK